MIVGLFILHDTQCWCVLSRSVVSDSAPLSMAILQARKLEWVAMPSSRGSSQPRD